MHRSQSHHRSRAGILEWFLLAVVAYCLIEFWLPIDVCAYYVLTAKGGR
jgi:hypothetical protein